MRIKIKLLTKEYEDQYKDFINNSEESLLYHSIKYRNFLKEILLNSKDYYFIAFDIDKIVGIFPIFIKRGRHGSVINSLPFYGSNGSIIINDKENYQIIFKELLEKYKKLCIKHKCLSSTIIENYKIENCYLSNKKFLSIDERISHVTNLSELNIGDKNKLENNILLGLSGNRRTDIRKGLKSGMDFSIDNSLESFKKLHEIHNNNMKKIGGIGKNYKIFESIINNFTKGYDYNIFVVRNKNEIVCSLLLLYFNKTVHYFTPAIKSSYRSTSIMSANIYLAMKKSIMDDFHWWDWGGSWIAQKNLIKFKSSWNPKNKKYRYFINFKKDVMKLTKKDILNEYKYFFVAPFNILSK